MSVTHKSRVSRALSSRWAVLLSLALLGGTTAAHVSSPEDPVSRALMLGPPVLLLLALFFFHRGDPSWLSYRFRGIGWTATLAGVLLLNMAVATLVLGGQASRWNDNGTYTYVARNHGRVTPLTTCEYLWLATSIPAALGAALVHCLIAHGSSRGQRSSDRPREQHSSSVRVL